MNSQKKVSPHAVDEPDRLAGLVHLEHISRPEHIFHDDTISNLERGAQVVLYVTCGLALLHECHAWHGIRLADGEISCKHLLLDAARQ